MSGPIVPPLQVTEVDGSPDGRPITKIIVSNGDLSISGRTATIDTSGTGGGPATPADAIQFNSDPAGTFTSDTFFKMSVIGGDGTTAIQAGNMILGGNKIAANTTNQSVSVICDGTGEVFLNSAADAGGTYTNSVVNIMCNANTNVAQLKYRDQTNTDNATITLNGSGDLVLSNSVAAKDIDLKVLTTGQVEVANQTTDTASVLSIMGNGTGDARLDMQNASERVWVVCDENKKLKIQGGSGGNTFIIDVSGAATGITFPDGTTQTTAASGGGATFNPVLPPVVGSADRHRISLAAPYGGTALTGTAQFADFQTCRGYPFIAPTSGDVTEIGIVVGTLTASADCLVGIYSDDSGVPETLMGYADIEMGAAGTIYQTSISATVTLVAQTQYWFVVGGDDTITGGVFTTLDDDYTCDIGLGFAPSGKRFCITHNASTTALPATFVPTSVHATPRPLVSLKIG